MKIKLPLISWILLAVTALIFVYIRLRLLSVPLERDEGEYAYAGQQILHGGVPYRDIYNMKFPGVYYFYAIFLAFFGDTIVAIRVGALLVNLLTSLFILKAGEKLKNFNTGIIAAAAFLVLSSSPTFHGIMANTEHFVNLFIAASAYFLFSWIQDGKKNQLLLTGIMTGLACLMKQHGSYFIVVAGAAVLIYTPLKKENILKILQRILILFAGFVLVMLLLLLSVLFTGTFNKFVLLTLKYSSSYISYHTFSYGIALFYNSFVYKISNNYLMWAMILLSLLLSFKILRLRLFIVLMFWLLLSFAAVFPGYYFREHYFLFIVPVASFYVGILLDYISSIKYAKFKYLLPLSAYILFIISTLYFLVKESDIFFKDDTATVSYRIYDTQFNEALTVADTIKNYVASNETLLVVGSEPEIYFYTKTKAATSYMYVYPLTENHPWRDSMLAEFAHQATHNNPSVVVVNGRWSINDSICKQKILDPLLNSKPGYFLKGICYSDGAYNEPFLWNDGDGHISKDSILWKIYLKKNN